MHRLLQGAYSNHGRAHQLPEPGPEVNDTTMSPPRGAATPLEPRVEQADPSAYAGSSLGASGISEEAQQALQSRLAPADTEKEQPPAAEHPAAMGLEGRVAAVTAAASLPPPQVASPSVSSTPQY